MQIEWINIPLAFLEGLALIVSPCILPILPIILSASLTGGKKRPIGIIVGFIIFFAIFTFYSRQLVAIAGINLNIVRYISFAILFILGCVLFSSKLTEKFSLLTQRIGALGASFTKPEGGFWYGLMFGGLIGLIWTPCAGPILAAVIVQTIIQKSNLNSLITIFCFSLGVGIPMLIITFFGQRIMNKLSFLKNNTTIIRKIFGVLIILSVVYMVIMTEKGFLLPQFTHVGRSFKPSNQLINPLKNPYPAPPIQGITEWINSPPLTLNALKGHVVLIDFWAYSCINCIRTIPDVNKWYENYHDKGLVIIGVHSPEFDFESEPENVKKAISSDHIQYPVALDNQFVTWQNYHNLYWPADYLIDKNGQVVYTHFGEGDYDIIENNIRILLGLNQMNIEAIKPEAMNITPETYLGYERADAFHSPEPVKKDTVNDYTYPTSLPEDNWALSGKWNIQNEKIETQANNASIKLHFHAQKVFAVMGSKTGKVITVKVFINGKFQKNLQVQNHTLYVLVKFPQPISGIVELIAETPNLEIYTFTF